VAVSKVKSFFLGIKHTAGRVIPLDALTMSWSEYRALAIGLAASLSLRLCSFMLAWSFATLISWSQWSGILEGMFVHGFAGTLARGDGATRLCLGLLVHDEIRWLGTSLVTGMLLAETL